MDFEQKVTHFREEMEYLGICQYAAAPLLYRFLWFLGIAEPPPFFTSRWRSLSIQAICYSFLMAFVLLTLHIFVAVNLSTSVNLFVIVLIFSLVYSFYMASNYQYQSRMLELPNWELYLSEKHKTNSAIIS
ncbi:DUF6404 family protein [Psychrosphaera haliotis]|nr:DUF6404 family protein [Psychrosphaera haliotis]